MPQLVSATVTTVSASRTHRIPPSGRLPDRELRDRDHGVPPVRQAPGEQRQEALFERASSGVDLVDPPTGRDDRGNEVRDPARVERLCCQPITVAEEWTELLLERVEGRRVEAGREHADARIPEDVDEPPLLDDPPVVHDRHPVADALDLGQQVRVEQHGRCRVIGRPG